MDKKVKSRFTVFLITVNSQHDYYHMTPELKAKFKEGVITLFDDNESFLSFTKMGLIKDTTSNYQYEIGSLQHRLHVHGIVTYEHTANMKLNLQKIKKLFLDLGFSIHLDVRASGDPVKAWEAYIKKNSNTIIEI